MAICFNNISLPFRDPIIVFSILLTIFLFLPIISKRLRLPGIIGLIVSGIVIGPHGFNIIPKEIGITLFGTVGLIYLMFIAALEINLSDFRKYRKHSIVFGLLTFFIPLISGFFITWFVFHLTFLSALLYSSIFSTHTLISYPIVAKYGLSKHRTTAIVIGGTIITDTGVLLLLTIISSITKNEIHWFFWIKLLVYFSLLTFTTLFVFSRISRWFLKHLQSESGLQYISVLFIVFLSAFLAKLLDIEPIIGAFFAGIALNGIIPHTSPLMNRILFIGNNLFIPFFLISVGMLIDLSVLFSGFQAIVFFVTMIFMAIGSKYIAAWSVQNYFRYSKIEKRLIFGLSTSHAAATIAVILVGYDLKLFSNEILNSTIFLILISCIFSSIVTENASQRLVSELSVEAQKTKAAIKSAHKTAPVSERILIPISNPDNLNYLLDFSIAIKTTSHHIPVYPLRIITEGAQDYESINQFKIEIDKYREKASATDTVLNTSIQKDISVVNGILTATKEHQITTLILGWNGKLSSANYFLGTLLEHLIRNANQQIIVLKMENLLENFRNLSIFVTSESEFEQGFQESINTLSLFAERMHLTVSFYGNQRVLEQIKTLIEIHTRKLRNQYIELEGWKKLNNLLETTSENTLTLALLDRPMAVSFSFGWRKIPKLFSLKLVNRSFGIIYPSIPYNQETLV